tara:strand:- start:517 stop:1122 length:606 start_codon:yes stop_codon:yes gene_type:complete
MDILIACEYSGTVRDAFRRRGHNAVSCDLLPSDSDGPHITGDVFDLLLDRKWDMMIAFPPCTHLAVSGARWFPEKRADGRQQEGIDFFMAMMNAPIDRIAVENPIGIMSTQYRRPDQIVQPWMFGHEEQKSTCLWLKNLPILDATDNVHEDMMALPKNKRERLHYLPPSEDRWKMRSKTFQGIAEAMADQWGQPISQLSLF